MAVEATDVTVREATPRHPVVGLSVALVSAAAFATSGAFAKSLLVAGWAPGSVVTLRITLAALVLLVPTLIALRGRWAAIRRNAWVVVGYGLTGVAGCQLAYFYAVTHLSVGVALLLEYLAPVLIVLWLWARHRQTPRRLTVLGVALAVVGLLLVLDVVGGGATVSLVGVLWGLGAAVCLVLYFLLAARVDDDVPALGLAGGGLAVGAAALWVAGLTGLLDTTTGSREVAAGWRRRAVVGADPRHRARRSGLRLRHRHRRGAAARAEGGLVRGPHRGALRGALRLDRARRAAGAGPAPRRCAHRRRVSSPSGPTSHAEPRAALRRRRPPQPRRIRQHADGWPRKDFVAGAAVP